MKVQTVTVKTHEKRAHPSAMGHYDAEVGYTAELEDGEDVTSAVELLQFQSRQHVAIECDRWEAGVKLEEKRSSARSSLNWIIERAKSGLFEESTQFEEHLLLFPAEVQADYRAKLAAAQVEQKANTEKRLNRYINLAAKTTLSWNDKDRFESFLQDVPEDERQAWQDKLAAAVAEYEAAQMGKEEPVNNG